eukprot:COSAG01_NODE_27803_length_676_cov_1.812825_2_plen_39_part_01
MANQHHMHRHEGPAELGGVDCTHQVPYRLWLILIAIAFA